MDLASFTERNQTTLLIASASFTAGSLLTFLSSPLGLLLSLISLMGLAYFFLSKFGFFKQPREKPSQPAYDV